MGINLSGLCDHLGRDVHTDRIEAELPHKSGRAPRAATEVNRPRTGYMIPDDGSRSL